MPGPRGYKGLKGGGVRNPASFTVYSDLFSDGLQIKFLWPSRLHYVCGERAQRG